MGRFNMSNQDILSMFGFTLKIGETLTGDDFAARIRSMYSSVQANVTAIESETRFKTITRHAVGHITVKFKRGVK